MKKIISIVLTLAVTIIVTATVLVPIISDAQKNAGEVVTYQNGNLYGYHLGDSKDSASFAFTTADGWSFNGQPVTNDGFAVLTDIVSIKISNSGSALITGPENYWDIRTSWNSSPATLVFENGKIIFDYQTSNPIHHEWEYTWILQPKENGEWQTKSGQYTVYANSINDVITVGYYRTGENDTAYSFKNGVLSVYEDYTVDATWDSQLVSGTTDVYRINNLVLHVGDESFSPWFVLVKNEITGHKDSGSAYVLYGIIPVIVLTAILALAVTAIRTRND